MNVINLENGKVGDFRDAGVEEGTGGIRRIRNLHELQNMIHFTFSSLLNFLLLNSPQKLIPAFLLEINGNKRREKTGEKKRKECNEIILCVLDHIDLLETRF